MNTHVTRFDIVSSNTEPADTYVFGMHGSIIMAIAMLFVVLTLGMAIWTLPVADIETISTAQSAPRSVDNSQNTEYFPAQYQIQATEIPEHIQAF